MSKILATAAKIVGVVVAIAAAIPSGGTSLLAGALGVSAATASLIAAGVGIAANLAVAALTKQTLPSTTISGNQSQFTASLDQGLPWVLGRTRTAGCAVHDITFDAVGTTANDFQTFYGVWSADRCYAVESTQIDNVTIDFSSPNATAGGSYANWMWHRSQLGLSPEPGALKAIDDLPYPPGWTPASKLSGMAAFSWTLRFDPQGKVYPSGTVPQKRDIIKGALAWDPRRDDTYPGGAGLQRADDPATWSYTENPFLLGLKWARGIFANGKKVMGIGMALAAINVDSAVQAANVADANGWKVGGVVYSTDPKYDVLKKICAAGSGEPIRVGGMLHFLVDAPKVSLDTITTDDLIGKCTAPNSTRMKDRINGVLPTFRSPDNDWQLVPATKVTIADYVTADGRPRTKAMTWELVQSADQVATLATYAICNAREVDGIVLPCKVRWIGYKPGDAVTVSSSVVAMDSQLVVLRKRNLDPASGAVTFTARTETTAKHAFALGQTTSPPPTPALATVNRSGLLNPGVDAAWSRTRDDDPVDHPRPEDGADVTATALPAAYQAFTGENARTVVENLATAIDALGSETLRGANYRAETDQIILMADGTPVRVYVQALGSTVGGHSAYIAFLQQVGGDGSAKAVFTVNGDGHIVGWEAIAGGTGPTNQLSFVASKFLFVDDSGANPINALTYENGAWRLKSIVVDTLAAGTITTEHIQIGAVSTSARTISASTLYGNGGWQQASSITLPAGFAAQCDIIGQADQGYASGLKGWGIRLLLNGSVLKSIQRTNPAAYTEIPTILRSGVSLPGDQPNVISIECLGADNSVHIDNADVSMVVRFV
ncbi:hypothetical protein [Sphingomonas bacterium]|uniref:hypothetical protein n=1 Tax=Sphingomonas bacterium TaxID=1895847 RepID=UPI001576B8C9|nr:hypothetical protein [Sphingomonas bacterium]